ncbi:MAG: ExeM/NucH family extracellular endonuclease, partial [Anaerolineae bacterium]|nr:ExeM/NucH family extracellular endonuclease [Anaerolineae bacterium]
IISPYNDPYSQVQPMRKNIILLLAFLMVLPHLSTAQSCGENAVLIHEIQGTEDDSAMKLAEDIVIEGIVVGDFQDTLDGFFVQEEESDWDSNPLTSEGIFIFDEGAFQVQVGDVVLVQGDVREMEHLTALRNVEVTVCGSGAAVAPTAVELPFMDYNAPEAYEGMLVTLPQTLTVTEVYELGRFGEVLLSSGGRLQQPTNAQLPGQEANLLQETNALNQIILDDNLTVQNPDPVPFLLEGTLRLGDTVTGLTGVLSYAFDTYRIQPTESPEFVRSNPRLDSPESTGGRIQVASFNVLNYFNGDGQGDGFPTSRGASNPEEWKRQHDKIISALTAINADVVGLMEIENDGYGENSAIQELVNGLGAPYAFVAPEFELGTDEIKVALIYRTDTVQPVGGPATTYDYPFDQRRPPLAQTFEELATGEIFTVVVNHFKSKGCEGARDENSDQGDGQSCWNAERTQASRTLIEWLATDPTGSGDPDILIIGDLNSYALEDPVLLLTDAGFTDLIDTFVGDTAYTYVFFGQAGTLDHALASPALVPQVTAVTLWHINADEPLIMDYNQEYKTPEQVDSLYAADPFRASDHDPVIVGLNLE